LAFLLLAALAAACVPQASAPVEEEQAIINGVDSDPTQDAVVRLTLREDTGIYNCTGTLLAPNLVLTARHCVSMTATGNIGCSSSGVGTAGGAVMADYPASSLFVSVGNVRRFNRDAGLASRPSGMKIYHDDATNLCNHDLALVLLSTKIDGAQIAPIRLDSPPAKGETFTAVGWGVTTTSASPMTRQQRTNIPILDVGPSGGFAGLPPNEFSIGEGPCEGDSGGPALDSTSGAILGVVSRGGNGMASTPTNPSANCIGGENIYTQVAPFKDLILQAYMDAGQDPWLEGQPNPLLAKFGESCGQNADCQSAMCLGATGGDGGAGFCTMDCTMQACAAGYDCRQDATLGTKVCTVHVPPSGGCATGAGGAPSGAVLLVLVGAFAWVARRRAF
jgi:hypothetical protein